VKHDCIAWSTLLPNNSWWFRESDRDLTYPVRVRFATTVAESALAAAESGLGIVQTTSYQAEAAIRAGRLERILEKFECAPTPVSLVYPTNRLVPLKLRAFLDFVAPRLAKRLKRTSALLCAQPPP